VILISVIMTGSDNAMNDKYFPNVGKWPKGGGFSKLCKTCRVKDHPICSLSDYDCSCCNETRRVILEDAP